MKMNDDAPRQDVSPQQPASGQDAPSPAPADTEHTNAPASGDGLQSAAAAGGPPCAETAKAPEAAILADAPDPVADGVDATSDDDPLPAAEPDAPASDWERAFEAAVQEAAEGGEALPENVAERNPVEESPIIDPDAATGFFTSAADALESASSHDPDGGDDWEAPQPRVRIPEKILLGLIGAVIAVVLFLMIDHYAGGPVSSSMATPTPKTPTATPVLAADGTPLYADAYFLPVGDGNCTLLTAPGGETLLVDTGSATAWPVVDALLTELGIRSIDLLILTSADEAHMGGAVQLIEQYRIGECRMTAAARADALLAPVCAALEAQDVPIIETIASYISVIDWADMVELRVLSPHDVDYRDAADDSIMLRMKFGASAVLLAGDAEALAERMAVKALPNRDFHADVLLVGSHGSERSTSEKFLGTVKPTIAIVSCGPGGSFSAAVRSRLEAHGAAIYRTDELGLIHIRLDGATAQVVE